MKRLVTPFSILIILSLFLTTGQGCLSSGGSSAVTLEPVTLNYWRVFDGEEAFDSIIKSYKAEHPNVKINYRKLRFDEYEDELIRAFAEGRGPDILSVHNTWLEGYQDLLLPMPSSVTVTEQVVQGTVRREVINVLKEKPTLSMRELKQTFVDQVYTDVVLDYQPSPKIDPVEKIYGLPLSMDSLALFYNKDLLNTAGISSPPQYWSEADFHEKVKALTSYDDSGEVVQSGAAIGTSRNVERSTDILSLLMTQVGINMLDERGRIAFQETPEEVMNALTFYTDFANPTKEVYTWNENFSSSFDAFANGETAFFFGYSYHIPLLRTRAPKLNFAIAPVPQIREQRKVNFANYWVEAVAASTDYPDWAWDFVQYEAEEGQTASYLAKANRPSVHRNLIATQLDNEDLGAFAEQTLTAYSWYHGKDIGASEEALKDLIDAVLAGIEDPRDIIEIAARRISQTM